MKLKLNNSDWLCYDMLYLLKYIWMQIYHRYRSSVSEYYYKSMGVGVMKLRYFKDDYLYFRILGVDTPTGLIELKCIPARYRVHKSLKEATVYMLQNLGLQRELHDIFSSYQIGSPEYSILVLMEEISPRRSTKSDNILHFCESALFRFNRHLKCTSAIFSFRKTIDPLMEYASLYYEGDNELYYSDRSVDAGEYFKYYTPDRELAEFVLNNRDSIIY